MSLILIKGARVINPATSSDDERDILVENGRIREITKNIIHAAGAEIIDAKNKIVVPGLIDMHVHLRDPGREDKETIITGTMAAAAGGFTSVACMANTDPVADNAAVIEYITQKARSRGIVNVFPIGAVTKGLMGRELAEMGYMKEAGAVAFSDDGRCIMDSAVMRHAIEYATKFGAVVISHSEDHGLSEGGSMNESYLSAVLGLKGIPHIAEEIMVQRDILIAKEYGPLHIAHVSTAGSVDLVRRAKEKGIPVTCETAPHYFTLTEEEVEGYNTNAKMNPPLRGEEDVAAVVQGLKDGTIDVIASDHAPHTQEDKNVEFALAANGIIGLETTLGLVITELVDSNILTMAEAVSKMTTNPAKILGIDKGFLKVGGEADITLFDPSREWTVDVEKFFSKSKNSPFHEWKLKGQVFCTMVKGRIVYRDGKIMQAVQT